MFHPTNICLKIFWQLGYKNEMLKNTQMNGKHVTRVLRLSRDQILQSFVFGLKPHTRNELEMQNVKTMEEYICKVKTIELKLRRSYKKILQSKLK